MYDAVDSFEVYARDVPVWLTSVETVVHVDNVVDSLEVCARGVVSLWLVSVEIFVVSVVDDVDFARRDVSIIWLVSIAIVTDDVVDTLDEGRMRGDVLI